MNSEFYKKLTEVCKEAVADEPMSRHTTFRIGGAADYFAKASSCEEVINIIDLCRRENVEYTVIGNGSNILVSDDGIPGVVIEAAINNIEVHDTKITAGAGVLLSKFANAAMEAGLSGLEFAAGIPGTVGGGIYMNAGAYGNELKDVITSVTYADEKGCIKTVGKEELDFGYRKSMFYGTKCIIISCEAELIHGKREEIKEKMTELNAKRAEKQPLSMPSAGSTFKRPEGYFAGSLIEQAGLKGYTIGGAAVSEKHAGFVVNKGGATAKDVIDLIKYIQKQVREKFSVELETEVKMLGRTERENT